MANTVWSPLGFAGRFEPEDRILMRKLRAFGRRVRRGEGLLAVYLAYYYTYLSIYDLRFGTNFSNSQTPTEIGSVEVGGTGNFPAHPRLVRRMLRRAQVEKDEAIVDIGHGSGSALFAASRAGYTRLAGIEYGRLPYELSVRNLGDRAHLIHGDAFSQDLRAYTALMFFNPFGGEVAASFFECLPVNVTTVCTINHDRIIEPIMVERGLRVVWTYQHPLYPPFNAKIWKRVNGH